MPGNKAGTGKKRKMPDRKTLLKYGAIAAVAIGLIAYAAVTASRDDGGRKLPDTSAPDASAAEQATDAYPEILPGTAAAEETQEPVSNEISEDYVRLLAGTDDKGNAVIACYVYVPAGYAALERPAYVTLKPDGMDITAQRNEPLKIRWSNVKAFDRLKSEGAYEDRNAGTYEIVAEYPYAAREDLAVSAYVIARTPSGEDDPVSWTIAIDLENNGLYPAVTVYGYDLGKYLNARYPDIVSFAQALFRPVEGYVPDDADDTDNTISGEEE